MGSHDSSYHTYLCSNQVNEQRSQYESWTTTTPRNQPSYWLKQYSYPCSPPAPHDTYHLCSATSPTGGSGRFLLIKPCSIHAVNSSKHKTNHFSPGLLQMKGKPCPLLHFSILMKDKPPSPVLHKIC